MTTSTPWRLVRLALIGTWAAMVFLYAFPRELRPDWLSDLRRPVAKAMRDAMIRPAHAVFSGNNGDRNRHLWAARFVAYDPDGTQRTLDEWPDGLTWSTPMGFFDVLDTVWYRKLTKGRQSKLSRLAGTDEESEYVGHLRRGAKVTSMLRFWCNSAWGARDGVPPEAVALDVWFASKSYRTGTVRMSAARIGFKACRGPTHVNDRWALSEPAPPWYTPPEESP